MNFTHACMSSVHTPPHPHRNLTANHPPTTCVRMGANGPRCHVHAAGHSHQVCHVPRHLRPRARVHRHHSGDFSLPVSHVDMHHPLLTSTVRSCVCRQMLCNGSTHCCWYGDNGMAVLLLYARSNECTLVYIPVHTEPTYCAASCCA